MPIKAAFLATALDHLGVEHKQDDLRAKVEKAKQKIRTKSDGTTNGKPKFVLVTPEMNVPTSQLKHTMLANLLDQLGVDSKQDLRPAINAASQKLLEDIGVSADTNKGPARLRPRLVLLR
jgi:hypothetical protein